MNRWILLTILTAGAALVPPPGLADTPGRYPHYLRARSDLRAAQYFLRVREEPNVTRNLIAADREVEAAIHEIDRAAVLDRKDIYDRPPADTRLDRPGRFRKIMALLNSARADIAREEDNPNARAWRDVAFRRIDAAMDFVRRAARDARIDHELGF